MFDSNRDELKPYHLMTGEYEVQARRQYFEDDDDDYYMAVGYGIRIFFYVVGSLIFLGILLCLWRCQRRRRRQSGQILSPPTQRALNTSAPYPQQMCAQPIYNTAPPPVPPAPNNPYPTVVYPAYPNTGATPYPTITPYPVASQYQASAAPYPGAASPYPAAGASYPAAGAPYPAAGVPYPAAGAPYSTGAPGGAPYPTPYPQPTAPSAPDASMYLGLAPPGWNAAALPPSYDQAVNMNKTH